MAGRAKLTKGEALVLGAEMACSAALLTGVILMFLDNFRGGRALWGLLLAGLGLAVFLIVHLFRREIGIRFRRPFR